MSEPARLILLVDDEPFSRELVRTELEEAGYGVVTASDGDEAWGRFRAQRFSLVITDLRMPRSDGVTLLRRIRASSSPQPQVPVILVSARGTLSVAVAAGRFGATDFFPLDDHGIEDLVRRAGEVLRADKPAWPLELLGESETIREVRSRLSAVAPLRSPLLIRGALHTGHSAAANYLHQQSHPSPGPLVHVVCARDRLSSLAPGRTLHLQDVERLDPESQKQALQWLIAWEEGAENAPRILASTSTDLRARSEEGRFEPRLADLLHRFVVELPSLADRIEDIPILVEALIRRIGQRLGRAQCALEPAAIEQLTRHSWPENFKELELVLESMVAFSGVRAVGPKEIAETLSFLCSPLDRISQRRRQQERERLIALFRKHGTYTGVARELGISRNAAKYRFAKHDLIPRPTGRRA